MLRQHAIPPAYGIKTRLTGYFSAQVPGAPADPIEKDPSRSHKRHRRKRGQEARRPICPSTISTLCFEQVHCAVYWPARRRQSPPNAERRDARRGNSLWLPKRSRSSVSSAFNLEDDAKCDCIHVTPPFIRSVINRSCADPTPLPRRYGKIKSRGGAVRTPFKIVWREEEQANG